MTAPGERSTRKRARHFAALPRPLPTGSAVERPRHRRRGANYPTAVAAMQAAETDAEAAPVEPNRDLAAQVMAFMRAKSEGGE